MIMFNNRLFYIFRGPPIKLFSVTRIKPHHVRCALGEVTWIKSHHVRCALGDCVHVKMLAKIKEERKVHVKIFYSEDDESESFSLDQMKLTPGQSPPVRHRASETDHVIMTRPMSWVCVHTCLDTWPVSHTHSVSTSRGWGSLPHPGLSPLIIGDSNLLVSVARSEGDISIGDSNLPIPNLQGGGDNIATYVATYRSISLYIPHFNPAAMSEAGSELHVNRTSGIYSDSWRLITSTAGSPGDGPESTVAGIANCVLVLIIVGHCQLCVISLSDGEVLLTDPLFTPTAQLYHFCVLFIDTDTGRIIKTSVTPAL